MGCTAETSVELERQQLGDRLAPSDQTRLAVFDQELGDQRARVVVGGHRSAVRARIVKDEQITHARGGQRTSLHHPASALGKHVAYRAPAKRNSLLFALPRVTVPAEGSPFRGHASACCV